MLIETPDAIRAVHARFLEAGADCIIAATYQASFPGLSRYGLSDKESERIFRLAVELAAEERNRFWRDPANRAGRRRPLVAASVGPYGAFLADGSEYTGDYAIDDAGLATFHWRRLEVLARAGADLLAVETIPSAREARVLRRLIERLDTAPPAWFSFTCRDGAHLSDGTPVEEIATDLARRFPDPLGRRQLHRPEASRRADPEDRCRQRQTGGRLPRTATAAGTRSGRSGKRPPKRRTCRSSLPSGDASARPSSAAAAARARRTFGECAMLSPPPERDRMPIDNYICQ